MLRVERSMRGECHLLGAYMCVCVEVSCGGDEGGYHIRH